MILIEKEWQDYKDSKTLYKLKVLAFFALLLNVGWHIYSFILAGLESGLQMDFIHIAELASNWGEVLLVFNCICLFFFLPIVILSNVGAVSKTKMKNSHFFATGVSKESMGIVKIGLSVFVPIFVYTFLAVAVCLITNLIFDNATITIDNTNLTISPVGLYIRPFAQVPFMAMCIAISLLAEQVGKDKLISIFFFFIGFGVLFAVLGLSSMMREGINEVFGYIFFTSATLNLQKFILGELLFLCIFIIAFTLSVMRYARNAKI